MAVEEVSAEELAGLDFDIDDPSLQEDAAPVVEEAFVAPHLGEAAAEDGAIEAPAEAAEHPAEDEAAVEEEDGLGFEEDVGTTQAADPYMQVEAETVEQDEQAWYSTAKTAAEGEEAEDGEEEEEEEEEEEAAADEPVDEEAAEEAASDGDNDDIMFFEDTARSASTATAPDAEKPQPVVAAQLGEAVAKLLEEPVGTCANCGLSGHTTTNCPFGHPEDIQLGDMEESDSDDEMPETYKLLSRYVSQHTGALVPKNKKGLTGEKRYFGDDKPYRQCWVCGAEDHESNDCKLKRCFFCGEPGHDSRGCPEKNKICSHCRCKGHLPMACPTLASQEIVSFANTHCMRCGELGHPSCPQPRPPPLGMAFAPMGSPQAFQNQPLLFNMGLPPATPASPPPSPGYMLPGPADGGVQSKAQSKAMSKASASMTFMNGGTRPSLNLPPPGKGKGKMVVMPTNTQVPDVAPMSKSAKALGKGMVTGKAPISKVPGGKAPISKVPGKGTGKVSIAKVTPTLEKDVKGQAGLMKASAKRPSQGGMPDPKRAKSNGKGKQKW